MTDTDLRWTDGRSPEDTDIVERLKAFNRGLAHDLRGPLSGLAKVASLGDEALQRSDVAAASRMLAVIQQQMGQLVDMVDSLFALAHLDGTPPAVTTVDLGSCIREAVEMLELCNTASTATQRDAWPLRLVIQAGGLPAVWADASLLRQVFFNLLGNAAKFSAARAGSPIRIDAIESKVEVLIAIQDEGVGFDDRQASELFRPFRRLHGKQFSGSGLGLFVVRHIVERHGGRIWAHGSPNAGATFMFTLPVAHPSAPGRAHDAPL